MKRSLKPSLGKVGLEKFGFRTVILGLGLGMMGLNGPLVGQDSAPGDTAWEVASPAVGSGDLGATETVFGLAHAPLGNAQLTIDRSGNLVVSDIGSSGKDGFVVDLGEAQFQTINFDPGATATSLPLGAFVEFSVVGELDGVPEQLIWSLRAEDIGDVFSLSLDSTPVAPASLEVQALLGGKVVESPSSGNRLESRHFPDDLGVSHRRPFRFGSSPEHFRGPTRLHDSRASRLAAPAVRRVRCHDCGTVSNDSHYRPGAPPCCRRSSSSVPRILTAHRWQRPLPACMAGG